MRTATSDMALFFKAAQGRLSGIMGTYVDDTVSVGTSSFLKASKATDDRFETKQREFDNTRFAGVYIEQLAYGFRIHQKEYIVLLKQLPLGCSFADSHSARLSLT